MVKATSEPGKNKPSSRASRRRSFVRILFLIIIQLLVVVLISEAALRILAKYNDTIRLLSYTPRFAGTYQYIYSLEKLLKQSSLGFKPYSDFAGFRLNSKSFRTREYSSQKDGDTYRILTIGDSFTFGSGGTPYKEHWPALLEEVLREEEQRKAEVINLGIGGVGTRFELRLWQIEGINLHPDLVILAFCIGNDVTDEQGILTNWSFSDKLEEFSYLFRIGRNFYRLKQSERHTVKASRPGLTSDDDTGGNTGGYEVDGYEYDSLSPTFSEKQYIRVVSTRMDMCKKANRPVFERYFNGVTPVILKFYQEVTAAGADFLFMMIPEEFQVDERIFHEMLTHTGQRASDYNVDWPQKRLTDFCDTHGIPYLDMLPGFRSAAAEQVLYRFRDTHWNIEGNALAVELLRNKISQEFDKSE